MHYVVLASISLLEQQLLYNLIVLRKYFVSTKLALFPYLLTLMLAITVDLLRLSL
jgi:hypothetical protein